MSSRSPQTHLPDNGHVPPAPLSAQAKAELWIGLGLASIFLAALTAASYVQRSGDSGFALFWPSAGVGLALAVRFGIPGLVATGLGVGLWAFLSREWTLFAALWAALASTAGPAWVRWSTRQIWIENTQPFARLESLFGIMRTQLAGSVLAATLGTAGLWWTAHWPNEWPVLAVWVGYWMLETCGALLFAPVASWLLSRRQDASPQSHLKDLLHSALTHWVGIGCTAALTLAVVAFQWMGEFEYAQAALYGLLPMLVLLALRAPPFLIHTMLLGAGALVLVTLAYLKRLPAWAGSDLISLALVLYLLAGSGVLLVVVASMEERRRSEARLAQAALIDPLTGFGNEAGLFHRLQIPLKAEPGDKPIRLLVSLSLAPFRLQQMENRLTDFYSIDNTMAATLRALQLPVWWSRTGIGVFRGVWVGNEEQTGSILATIQGVCSHTQHGALPWSVAGALAHLPAANQCPPQTQLSQLAQAELRAHQFRRLELAHITIENLESLRQEGELMDCLRLAIEQHTLVLLAQPIAPNGKVGSHSGADQCVAVAPQKAEVLVRLARPNLGTDANLLSPGVFLPIAMRAGLMAQLDRAVIEMTLQAMAVNRSDGAPRCAINLSGPTVMDEQLAPWVAGLLEQQGIAPDRLVFEVTESMAMTDLTSAAQTLTALRALGCQVAIDDFGTGMATFDYLKRFPVDTVKIDGSFIQPLEKCNGVDRVIVESMVNVAKSLKLTTVAEFVSSPTLHQAVCELGIDESQGYAVGMPEPLQTWLAAAQV